MWSKFDNVTRILTIEVVQTTHTYIWNLKEMPNINAQQDQYYLHLIVQD